MVFKSYRFKLLTRLVVMLVFAFAGMACVFWFGFIYTTFIVLGLLVFSIIEFFRFSDKTNRELQQFLLSIKYHDFSTQYNASLDLSNKELRETYNIITTEFNRLKLEKEYNHIFLQSIVEQVPIGIISVVADGSIILFNRAAKQSTGIEHLANIQQLQKVNDTLFKATQAAKTSGTQIVTFLNESEEHTLSITLEEIPVGSTVHSLYLLQNIKNELDKQEIESWQKLIRVITHEIMNSITPIASLSATLYESLQKQPIDTETLTDITAGMNAIKNRSESLTEFVDSYRQIARVPKPEARHFDIGETVKRIAGLYENTAKENGVTISCHVDTADLDVFADERQVEQVLTNMVNNAIDAVGAEGKISLHAVHDEKNVTLTIADNGKGIELDYLDKIFIPFFTTKQHGSGIGLTLSRQLLYNNRASVSVKSEVGKGTVFIIKFWR